MKMYVKFDFNTLCMKVLEEKLKDQGLKYRLLNFGEVELYGTLTQEQSKVFRENLEDYGIEIIESQKTALVQKIKDAIAEFVGSNEAVPVKASIYIAEKLNHSYGYLSNVFSDTTNISIENFIIIQKIEYAKELIIGKRYNLTEIAQLLNYSSVAHLSTQFKNLTGITPSHFQKIIAMRRKIHRHDSYYSKAI
jgi:AraC-like DNA-binding protein